jgi:hypothetical protein
MRRNHEAPVALARKEIVEWMARIYKGMEKWRLAGFAPYG